jgi:hypothetical protein
VGLRRRSLPFVAEASSDGRSMLRGGTEAGLDDLKRPTMGEPPMHDQHTLVAASTGIDAAASVC